MKYNWIAIAPHNGNYCNKVCKRCGVTEELAYPVRLDSLNKIFKAFIEIHKNCKTK